VVLDALAPIQARYREIVADPDALDSILTDGAERARALAAPVLSRVKSAIGVG
jgi:tryptophanyl-tRNA synthetase